jgi:hypothetical protein
VKHNIRFKKNKFFFLLLKKKKLLPTGIKIAVGNVNLILPLLQEPVEMSVLKLKSHFGFFTAYSVGMAS